MPDDGRPGSVWPEKRPRRLNRFAQRALVSQAVDRPALFEQRLPGQLCAGQREGLARVKLVIAGAEPVMEQLVDRRAGGVFGILLCPGALVDLVQQRIGAGLRFGERLKVG